MRINTRNWLCALVMALVLESLFAAHTLAEMTAADIISAAHDAAGGELWRRPKTLELEGHATFYRGAEPLEVDDYRMWRVFPGVSADAHVANGQVRFDGYSEGRLVFQVSFDGRHSYNMDGRIEDEQASERWASNFGFGIIRFALDDGFILHRLEDQDIEGHACYTVTVTDPAGKDTVFAIDRVSYYVRMVGFDTPRGWHHRLYDDFEWHEEPRFLQPTRVRLFYDGVLSNDITWKEYHVNRPIDPGLFTLEAGH